MERVRRIWHSGAGAVGRVARSGCRMPGGLAVPSDRTVRVGRVPDAGHRADSAARAAGSRRTAFATIAILVVICAAMVLVPAIPGYAEEADGTGESAAEGSGAGTSTESDASAGSNDGGDSAGSSASSGAADGGGNVGVATECTVAELAAVYEDMDGAVVKVTGEVVGEAIPADDGEHTWISISQDGTAMSVYMSDADAETIQHFGSYGEIGDTITVEGIYHVDCSSHDGDLDIHVTSMTLDDEGSASVAEIDTTRLYVAVAVVAVGLALGFVYWRLKERQR